MKVQYTCQYFADKHSIRSHWLFQLDVGCVNIPIISPRASTEPRLLISGQNLRISSHFSKGTGSSNSQPSRCIWNVHLESAGIRENDLMQEN